MFCRGNTVRERFRNSIAVRAINAGFELSIPFLVIGAFALLLRNLPLPAYQKYIGEVLGGAIPTILVSLYTYTLGSISLILCLTISSSYAKITGNAENYLYAATALASYMGFCSSALRSDNYIFDAQWLFTALCITLISCYLFRLSEKYIRLGDKFYMPGASYLYNIAIRHLVPIILIVLFFTLSGYILRQIFGQENITNFGSELLLQIFTNIDSGLARSLLYVFLIQIFWFFGIHGTNVLEAVAKQVFEPLVEVNTQLVLSSQAASELYSSTFFNTFVFMGGCGSTLCMAIAMILFSRRSQNRRLAFNTFPTVLFNVNEILLFGFPVVFNPAMFVPFIIVPVIQTCVSVFAMRTGLVPYASFGASWTIPALFSGYITTGSVAGSVLQVFNIILGVAFYAPFIRLHETRQSENFKQAVTEMQADIYRQETSGKAAGLTEFGYAHYSYARALSLDLENALRKKELVLYYQPQICNDQWIYGVEALLRWNHPVAGFISPPLIIALATETGLISELTYYIMEKACGDSQVMDPHLRHELHLSINISADHIEEPDFCERVKAIMKAVSGSRIRPLIEVTERTIMQTSEESQDKITQLRAAGIQFSIDDFGMGHNSLAMLQEELFDEIKVDGSLTAQIVENKRSREIASKIINLSKNLNYRVVAEFVETKEQLDMLHEMGCDIYQGYYYSPPLPLEQLVGYIDKWNKDISDTGLG